MEDREAGLCQEWRRNNREAHVAGGKHRGGNGGVGISEGSLGARS